MGSIKWDEVVTGSIPVFQSDEDIYDDVKNKEAEARELISEKLKNELPQKIRDLLKELGLGEDK